MRSAWNIGGRGEYQGPGTESLINAAHTVANFAENIAQLAEDMYRGICVDVFHYVVRNTPQWSGNAAANWNMGVGHRDTTYDTTLKVEQFAQAAADGAKHGAFGKPSFEKGDAPAMLTAVGRNSGRPEQIQLGMPVYITNYARNLAGETYISRLEENPNDFLRPVNRPGHMVASASAQVEILLAVTGRTEAVILSNLQLGNFYGGVLYDMG